MIPFLPCRNQSGNVAVFFALAIIPIVGVIGLSMDYEATVNSKTKVQSVVDTAILAASKHYRAGGDKNATESFAQSMIKDQLDNHNTDLDCATASVAVGDDDNTLGITIDCDHDTSLMGVLGFTEIDFTVTSNSRWDYDKLEVAFIFDNSGSMDASEISQLVAAANAALDVMMPNGGTSPIADTRMAMVNFNTALNAGTYFEAVTGIKPEREYVAYDDFLDPTGTPDTTERRISVNNTCVMERFGDYAFTDAAPDASAGALASSIPYDERSGDLPAGDHLKDNWHLFQVSATDENPEAFLGAPLRYIVDKPTVADVFWVFSPHRDCPDKEPLPLTDQRSDLDAYLGQFKKEHGRTAGHQGMAWGWYMLSPKWKNIWPTASEPGSYTDSSILKAIIFMTDGEMDGWDYGQGDPDQQGRALCANIKAQTDIRIYVVGFKMSTSPTGKDFIEHCASSANHIYLAENGGDLARAYKAIADELVALRITS